MNKRTVYPSYYNRFACIADRCRHSCCIGWEIDIDGRSLDYYDSLEGPIAQRLRASISREGTPHFRLGEGERCPFLNEKGLCDLILSVGEDALCEICAQHPRFYNHYENVTEAGLGLCCEAAAELILHDDTPFALEHFDLNSEDYTENEREVLSLRSALIAQMQDQSLSIKECHARILELMDCQMPERSVMDWARVYLDLERLDDRWTVLLRRLEEERIEDVYRVADEGLSIPLEQLTVYFLYRHFSAAETWEQAQALLMFAVLSTQIVMALLSLRGEQEDIAEYARMYSSEIEYSDENVWRLCNELME